MTLRWRGMPTMKKAFIPEPDITTYELAEIFSNVGGNTNGMVPRAGIFFTQEIWGELPEGIKRHFKDLPS